MYPAPSDPHLRRWMMFIDGENIVQRGQRIARERGLKLEVGEFYQPDVFVWLPGVRPTAALTNNDLTPVLVQPHAIRSHYYTSVCGDPPLVEAIRGQLWRLGFKPQVFKKSRRDEKAKGVDIALTKDILSHAHRDNYDVAVIMTGDGDFVPVIEEVQRLGKIVYVGAFSDSGLSEEVKLASDMFFSLDKFFCDQWERFHEAKKQASE